MTEAELQAIRARAEAATEGRWGAFPIEGAPEFVVIGFDAGSEMVAELVYEKADAEFIAAARQDVPKLLAEVERLRGQFKHIAEITEGLYEVDYVYGTGDSAISKIKLPESLAPHKEYLNEILIVSNEEAYGDGE